LPLQVFFWYNSAMKSGLFLFIIIVIAVIVAGSFGLQLAPGPHYDLADSVAANALFVCPAQSETFDMAARSFASAQGTLVIIFFFVLMLVFALYAWGLYKNLLADKFDAKEYKNAWFLAKTLFWATIIVTILIRTPNYFRTVRVSGADGAFVLCDGNTPGAKPVRADAVAIGPKILP